MVKKILIGIAILFGLLIVAAIFDDAPDGQSSSTAESEDAASAVGAEPDVVASAADISKLYQENEAKAQLAYDDKTVEVTGVVKDIDLDFSDNPVVVLKGHGDRFDMGVSEGGKITDVRINGIPNEIAADISKGQSLTFICGSITEVMGGAGLGDCALKQE